MIEDTPSEDNTSVITVDSLSKSFRTVQAVSNLTFSVHKGAFFGFLGPNGAGKTTTIKILTGQLLPDSGKATVLGYPLDSPLHIKKAVGIVPEITLLPSFLSAREYLEFVCTVRGMDKNTQSIDWWLDFVGLMGSAQILCKDLSQGMKQKLAFSAAFIHNPSLVFLDEPFADVDPLMQNTLKAFLRDYIQKGGTVFLSTHILEIAEKLCSYIAIINKGEIIEEGILTDLLQGGETLETLFLSLVSADE
jgi:ABC-2 type transport system ATP-binding protein